MGDVDLFSQKTAACKLDHNSSGRCYYLRLFFDVMDISVVSSHVIYKVFYPKGTGLLDFKIILAKWLIGTYNSRSRNTPVTQSVSHVSCQATVPLHLPILQKK